jgi:PHD/YefM family antitoxin component YafN of YafNO toxin-antitoxin module
MKVYNYSEARQNFAAIFNTALKEEVIITRKDGYKFRLVTIHEQKKEALRWKP